MNNTSEKRQPYSDEIGLVDLAAIFIKRRRIFYIVFLVITLGGLAYALLTSEKYRYTSLLQVAEKSSGEYLEEPATTIATLQNRWLPEQETLFREEANKKLPFEVVFSNPDETGLVRFVTEATLADRASVGRIHQKLIDKIQARQSALLEHERQSLMSSIDSVDRAIKTLQGGENTGTAIAEAFERKVDLERGLDSLKDAEVLVVSRQSTDKTGPARALIVILSIVLSCMFGVFLTFFAEFAAVVKLQVQGESAE